MKCCKWFVVVFLVFFNLRATYSKPGDASILFINNQNTGIKLSSFKVMVVNLLNKKLPINGQHKEKVKGRLGPVKVSGKVNVKFAILRSKKAITISGKSNGFDVVIPINYQVWTSKNHKVNEFADFRIGVQMKEKDCCLQASMSCAFEPNSKAIKVPYSISFSKKRLKGDLPFSSSVLSGWISKDVDALCKNIEQIYNDSKLHCRSADVKSC